MTYNLRYNNAVISTKPVRDERARGEILCPMQAVLEGQRGIAGDFSTALRSARNVADSGGYRGKQKKINKGNGKFFRIGKIKNDYYDGL